MKVYFKIFGWLLYSVTLIIYLVLWFKAYKYITDKIGSFLAFVLVLATNVVGPLLYTIWYWIDNSFPTQYFLLWIGAIVAFKIAGFIIGLSSDE